MLQFAVNLSTIFTEYSLIERFKYAKAHGFDVVEIQFPYSLSISEIQQQLDLHQLKLCLINVPAGDLMQGGDGLAGIPGREHEFAQALAQAIAYAQALKVPRINVLAGRQPADASLDDCLSTLCSNLKLACQAAANINCTVVFELINAVNMPNFIVQDMALAEQIINQLQQPNLKVQYDCFHVAMMGHDICQHYINHHHLIEHIQFADFPHRHEPGTGQLNFETFFKTLSDHQYNGYIAAEYIPQHHSEDSFEWCSAHCSP